MNRFNGSCEPLAKVSVDDLIAWITDLNYAFVKEPYRPCVVVDPVFLQDKTDRVVSEITGFFPGCRPTGVSITATNPGDYVPFHTDTCSPEWITRIHVPIVTNPYTWFISDALAWNMEVGMSYKVNPSRPHAVSNFGDKTRVHLMFDVVSHGHGVTPHD